MPNINKNIYPSIPSAITPVPHSNELPQRVFHELTTDVVHYETPESEDKDMENLIENSSDKRWYCK